MILCRRLSAGSALKQIVPLPVFALNPRLPQLAPATLEGLIATAANGHANGPQLNHSGSADQERRNARREPGSPEAGCVHRSSLSKNAKVCSRSLENYAKWEAGDEAVEDFLRLRRALCKYLQLA